MARKKKSDPFAILRREPGAPAEEIRLSEVHAKVRGIWAFRERCIASGHPEVAACFGTMVETFARIMEQTGSAISDRYRLVIDTPERIFS